MYMSEIQDTDKIYVPTEEKPARKKFHLIILPALLVLGVMVYLFLKTAYVSTLDYNVRDGIFGSPSAGLNNYRIAFRFFGSLLGNTLLIKIIMLVVCGLLSAGLCTMYKAMKKPGTILTAACLWLVPLVLPSFMLALAFVRLPDPGSFFSGGLLYLLSEGLQTVSLFCFTAGLFAWLNMRKGNDAGKGAYSGLLTAILVWLLGNLTTNGILYFFQKTYLYSQSFDCDIFLFEYSHLMRSESNSIPAIVILLFLFVR